MNETRSINRKRTLLKSIRQQVMYLNHKKVESIQSVHRKIPQRLERLIDKFNNTIEVGQRDLYAFMNGNILTIQSKTKL